MSGAQHKWASRAIHDFAHNPRVQFRFHLIAMAFWMVNLLAGTVLMFLAPQLWLEVGIFYVFVLSIYANWDTDYDALSASLAAMHSGDLLEAHAQEARERLKEIHQDVAPNEGTRDG